MIYRHMTYITPPDFRCPLCGSLTEIVPLINHFEYTGTHCTAGLSGTHYPDDFGSPVTKCCEESVKAALQDNEPYNFE